MSHIVMLTTHMRLMHIYTSSVCSTFRDYRYIQLQRFVLVFVVVFESVGALLIIL